MGRGSPPTALSVTAFVLSAVVFAHQCVLPMLDTGQMRAAARTVWARRTPQRSEVHAQAPLLRTRARTADGTAQEEGASLQPNSAARTPVAAAAETGRQAVAAIPKGPFPLPELPGTSAGAGADKRGGLGVQASSGGDPPSTATTDTTAAASAAGSSWSMSRVRGMLPAMPAHWAAEVARAATAMTASLPSPPSSIFRARRKGDWIGCARPFHLICKGVYRAAKHASALTLLSLSCRADAPWLPYVARKLHAELRPVRLYCALDKAAGPNATADARDDPDLAAEVHASYGEAGLAGVVRADVHAGNLGVPKVDMVIAYRALATRTLIDGVRLLRGIKASRAATLLVTETFPDTDNADAGAASARAAHGGHRVNVATAPFLFPAPVFEYANDEENADSEDMEIVAVHVAHLFEERLTPEMKDLVDPRKRVVLE